MAPEAPELRQQQQLRRSRSVDVDLHGPRSAAPGHRQLEDRTPKALVGGQQRRPDGLSGHDRRHTVLHLRRKMRRCAGLDRGAAQVVRSLHHRRRPPWRRRTSGLALRRGPSASPNTSGWIPHGTRLYPTASAVASRCSPPSEPYLRGYTQRPACGRAIDSPCLAETTREAAPPARDEPPKSIILGLALQCLLLPRGSVSRVWLATALAPP